MRVNEPVTNREIVMQDGDILVSRTDSGGRIVFVNRSFIDISGFSEQELIGQPHNIVRHPQMPKEAFADLWRTIQAGKSWEGLVKNRTKIGDFYWVRANVTPIVEEGAIKGFLSVRSKPSRDEVAAAGAVYEQFVAGRAGNRRVEGGQVVRRGLAATLSMLKQSVMARVMATLLVLSLSMALIAALGAKGQWNAGSHMGGMYEEQILPLLQLKNVADKYAVDIVDATHKVRNGGSSGLSWTEAASSIESARKAIDEQWSAFTASSLTPEETRLRDETVPLLQDADAKLDELAAILQTQDHAKLDAFVKDTLYQKIDPILAKISQLIDIQPKLAEENLATIAAAGTMDLYVNAIVFFLAIGIALVMGFVVYRSLHAPVRRLDSQLSAIARGEYNSLVPDDPIVEYRPISAIIRAMRAQLSYGVLEKRELDEQAAQKRKQALRDMADSVESETTDTVNSIAAFTGEMSGSATQMTEAARSVSLNSQAVAAAATEALSSAQTVSSATEELAASIREIGAQVAQTAEVSRQATSTSEHAMADMNQLSSVVERITSITGVIREVAAQTNLLALNATIEAARAGDAGKGFAVVANEVKNLALQTANSTTDIERTVEEIRAATQTTISSVSNIVTRINEVNTFTTNIATAVEQQAAATGEIARSVDQVADAAKEVAQRINDVASQAELSEQQASQVSKHASQVDESVTDLRVAIVRAVRHVDQDVDRRKSQRYTLPLKIECVINHGTVVTAELRDISMGGAKIVLPDERPVGSQVELRLDPSVPPLQLSILEQRHEMSRGRFNLDANTEKRLAAFIGAIEKTATKAV